MAAESPTRTCAVAGPTATRGHGAPRSATAKWGKKWGRVSTGKGVWRAAVRPRSGCLTVHVPDVIWLVNQLINTHGAPLQHRRTTAPDHGGPREGHGEARLRRRVCGRHRPGGP